MCGGGGGTGRSEVETLSISASVFTVWGTSVSAEGVTLFSEDSGTGHYGGGHHSYIVGAPCERYGAWGVISVSSEPKPGDILDTGGGGLFLCLISESLGKRWDRGTTIAALLEHIEWGGVPGINKKYKDILKVVLT